MISFRILIPFCIPAAFFGHSTFLIKVFKPFNILFFNCTIKGHDLKAFPRRRKFNVYYIKSLCESGGDECCDKEVRVLCDEEVRDMCDEKSKGTVE